MVKNAELGALLLTKVRVQNSFHLIPTLSRAENFTESTFKSNDKDTLIWLYYNLFLIDVYLIDELHRHV